MKNRTNVKWYKKQQAAQWKREGERERKKSCTKIQNRKFDQMFDQTKRNARTKMRKEWQRRSTISWTSPDWMGRPATFLARRIRKVIVEHRRSARPNWAAIRRVSKRDTVRFFAADVPNCSWWRSHDFGRWAEPNRCRWRPHRFQDFPASPFRLPPSSAERANCPFPAMNFVYRVRLGTNVRTFGSCLWKSKMNQISINFDWKRRARKTSNNQIPFPITTWAKLLMIKSRHKRIGREINLGGISLCEWVDKSFEMKW